MKKTKKLLLLLTVFSILVVSLTACNRSPLDPDEPVTLTMWHNYGGDMQQAMDLLIDEFNSTVGRSRASLLMLPPSPPAPN